MSPGSGSIASFSGFVCAKYKSGGVWWQAAVIHSEAEELIAWGGCSGRDPATALGLESNTHKNKNKNKYQSTPIAFAQEAEAREDH